MRGSVLVKAGFAGQPAGAARAGGSTSPQNRASAGDHIGSRLRRFRDAAGLDVAEVARALGWPTNYVEALEGGILSILFADAVALAELYGVDLQDLRDGAVVRTDTQAAPGPRRGSRTRPDAGGPAR